MSKKESIVIVGAGGLAISKALKSKLEKEYNCEIVNANTDRPKKVLVCEDFSLPCSVIHELKELPHDSMIIPFNDHGSYRRFEKRDKRKNFRN